MAWRGILAVCLALAGCATPEQLAQQDDAKCLSYGATRGDPAYVACRAQLDSARTVAAHSGSSIAAPGPIQTGGLWHPGRF